MVQIRKEKSGDAEAIRHVISEAFGRQGEAQVVDMLREAKKPVISLVAICERQLAGHVLFSEVTINPSLPGFSGMCLGPIAVLPRFQKRGIGSQLIREGISECQRADYDIAAVYGGGYYLHHGFSRAGDYGLSCEGNIEYFMAMELREGALAEISGSLVKCRPEFHILDT